MTFEGKQIYFRCFRAKFDMPQPKLNVCLKVE